MKKSLIILASVLIVVLFAAGLSAKPVQAVGGGLTQPAGVCKFLIEILKTNYNLAEGSRWDPSSEKCYYGFKDPATGAKNSCHPGLDIYQTVWTGPTSWHFDFAGCTSTGEFVKDPLKGELKLPGGLSFEYEGQTCANGCRVTKYGLTPAGKNALGSLNGRILGKTYVQIRDNAGDLTEGEFKLCFPAKGAKNPSFFRLGGGNSWVWLGGFWNGNSFCMRGTISGNYVLADQP